MTIIHWTAAALALAMSLAPVPLLAQSYEMRLQARLPTVSEVRRHAGSYAALDGYTLKKYRLSCDLPSGERAATVLVNDNENFTFLALRSNGKPVILANERYIPAQDQAYAVFSFYRECGIHAVQEVTVADTGDSHEYDVSVIRDAECLAVIPAQLALGSAQLPFERIAARLREEYGNRGSSTASMLERCAHRGEVQTISRRLLESPVKRK